MKLKLPLLIVVAALAVSGCDQSELAKQLEDGAKTSKKMAGDVREVPRVIVTPVGGPNGGGDNK